ncbi:hypothetical protein JAB5_25620 [Janthinobacterium sp. HH103]|nr:hypothetical protein JAB2_07550 [Janthinobacterium sp. HH100]OEZ77641.1 hypothetical protein JAB5_25620 [Janthinobacterium sp. HH103]QOU74323.1 hypothetical protein JAB4_037860 [Janthinobacterium sp. HH102]
MRPPGERAGRHAGSLANRLASLLLVSLLTGCAAWGPASQVQAWPVSAPCIATRPASPALPAVPAHGIFEQVQALLAREQLRAAHVRQLEALLDACAGG